ANGLNAQLNNLSTAWFELRADVSGGLFNDVTTTSVKLMADNLKELAGAITLVAGVGAARLAGLGLSSVGRAVASPIRGKLADAADARSVAALAQERARDAAAQVKQAEASLAQAAAWKAQSAAAADLARGQMAIAYSANERAQAALL